MGCSKVEIVNAFIIPEGLFQASVNLNTIGNFLIPEFIEFHFGRVMMIMKGAK
jgi:hypothetical protein